MPELPEVECVRSQLQQFCVGATVRLVAVARRDVVRGVCWSRSPQPSMTMIEKSSLLNRCVISSVQRKGKQIALVAEDGRALIFRLGMTGQVLIVDSLDQDLDHVHLVWLLAAKENRKLLLFRDARRFGSLVVCRTQEELSDWWSLLGPDALSLSTTALRRQLLQSRCCVKAHLLNQSRIAGLGNIYVDEALFLTRIHPKTIACDLTNTQVVALARSIRVVLKKSITYGGTTLRDYKTPDGMKGTFQRHLRVYGRGGGLCTRCKSLVEREVVAGRSTWFCPRCQAR